MQAEHKLSLSALSPSEADPLATNRLEEARTMVVKRGLPGKADVAAFLAAGFSERHILEIVLAISVKTLSNYANHLFHTPVDGAFAGRVWSDSPAQACSRCAA